MHKVKIKRNSCRHDGKFVVTYKAVLQQLKCKGIASISGTNKMLSHELNIATNGSFAARNSIHSAKEPDYLKWQPAGICALKAPLAVELWQPARAWASHVLPPPFQERSLHRKNKNARNSSVKCQAAVSWD
jgi:hypothetical protein